jgi:DNA repair protein RadC
MKNVKPSNELYTTESTFEQENQLIAEAKHLLYSRLKTRDQVFTSPHATRDYLCLQLCDRQHEVFCCMFLDSQHRLIEYQELFVGTIDACSVYPREVVKAALKVNAAAVIFAHNHPSGVAEPSAADQRITERLTSALGLLDIRVLDHFVVGDNTAVSFAERGLL